MEEISTAIEERARLCVLVFSKISVVPRLPSHDPTTTLCNHRVATYIRRLAASIRCPRSPFSVILFLSSSFFKRNVTFTRHKSRSYVPSSIASLQLPLLNDAKRNRVLRVRQ